MTVKEIVKAYLDANGFDGLFSDDGDCACQKDDLAPCGGCDNIMDCEPGDLSYGMHLRRARLAYLEKQRIACRWPLVMSFGIAGGGPSEERKHR